MTRILVAEDVPDVANVLRLGLGQHGFEVIEARDGESAFNTLMSEKIEVVLLDVHLPRINGVILAQRILSGQVPRPTVVALLSADVALLAQLERRGIADVYWKKPFRVHEIAAEIQRMLDERAPS